MTLRIADRVRELLATAPGTGAFTLGYPVTGFVGFENIAGIANGDTVYYCAVDSNNDFEIGIGTYSTSSGNQLLRNQVITTSSGGTSAISLSSNVNLFSDIPAEVFVSLISLLDLTSNNGTTVEFTSRPTFNNATPWDSSNLPSPFTTSGGTISGNLNVTGNIGASISNYSCAFNGNATYQLILQGANTSTAPQIQMTYPGIANKYLRIDSGGNFGIVNSAYNAQILTLSDAGYLTLNSGASINGTATIANGVVINGGFVNNYSNYGYMTGGNVGIISGNSTNVTIGLQVSNRIWCESEIDCTSDFRLKDNIQKISGDDGLKFIKSVNPVKFIWNENSGQGGNLASGYVAQNVLKEHYSHMVNLHSKTGMVEHVDEDGFVSPFDTQFTVNYQAAIPYLHAALIKAFEEIEILKSIINSSK